MENQRPLTGPMAQHGQVQRTQASGPRARAAQAGPGGDAVCGPVSREHAGPGEASGQCVSAQGRPSGAVSDGAGGPANWPTWPGGPRAPTFRRNNPSFQRNQPIVLPLFLSFSDNFTQPPDFLLIRAHQSPGDSRRDGTAPAGTAPLRRTAKRGAN